MAQAKAELIPFPKSKRRPRRSHVVHEAPLWLVGRDEAIAAKEGLDETFFTYIRVAAKACELPLSKIRISDPQEVLTDLEAVRAALYEMIEIVEAGKTRITAATIDQRFGA